MGPASVHTAAWLSCKCSGMDPPLASWIAVGAVPPQVSIVAPGRDAVHCFGSAALWLPLHMTGQIRALTRYMVQVLPAVNWYHLLYWHFTQLPTRLAGVLRVSGLSTVLAHEGHSEARLIIGLVNACEMLGHFPRSLEPALLSNTSCAYVVSPTGWMGMSTTGQCTKAPLPGGSQCRTAYFHLPCGVSPVSQGGTLALGDVSR